MPTPQPPIPYGWSDFALMGRERFEMYCEIKLRGALVRQDANDPV